MIDDSGTWCLEQDPARNATPDFPYSAKYHHPADAGIANAIIKHLTCDLKGDETFSNIDIGAGVGQYGLFFSNATNRIKWTG